MAELLSPAIAAPLATRRKSLILASVCLCVLVVLIDTSIMNVTLPALVRQLGATTRDLQWIVDAYNLTFASLVLAAGSMADRFGRRRSMITGLTVLTAFSIAGASATSPWHLILARAGMGVGAAIVFPATLSILTNVFTEREERAKAIGLWGAMTGVGVALGPIVGGWMLGHFWWGSVLWIMVPLAVLAIIGAVLIVPESRDPSVPRIDRAGLLLVTAAVGTLVFTIIEAPDAGWTAPRTVGGFLLAAVLAITFARVELAQSEPMIDVRLFKNLRFSAASGAVTVAFFALFGFIFLITQYMQFVKGYSALSAGVRLLPVAISVGTGSVLGTKLAVRFGNRKVVATGLASMTIGFVWVSFASVATSYTEIVFQMIFLTGGLGLTSAPATEAIMGVVPKEKAGIGSAMNDATRELGGTLGVAIIGSAYASVYADRIATAPVGKLLPPQAREIWTESIGAALSVADRAAQVAGPAAGDAVATAAKGAFIDGLSVGCWVAATVTFVGSVFVIRFLPDRPTPVSLD